MGRDTVQLETAVSTISQEYLLEFTFEYDISEDLHPELPSPGERIMDFPEGKVDERVFPTVANWRTSAPKDEMPAENIYSPEAVMVKTGTHPRTAHEVPLLIVTASRVIEIEDPTAATDSSRVPSTIERSPLDFANENPSQQSTRESLGGKSIAAMGLGMGSTCPVPTLRNAPVDVSDLNPLSFEDPQSLHTADVAQSSKGAATAGGVTNGCLLDAPEACQDLVDHIAPPDYFLELRHLHNDDFLKPYNINLARQVAMGSQLRLRFEHEAKPLKKSVAQVAHRDKRIQARENEIKNLKTLLEAETDMKKIAEGKSAKLGKELENLRVLFSDLQVSNDRLSQQVSTLQAQRCAKMDARLDALSIDFDEELYPHMLTAIAGRRWVIGHGLRLPVMKCGESTYLRQWIRELRLSSSQLKIPVYPEVRDPTDPWACKEEILLANAIAANVSAEWYRYPVGGCGYISRDIRGWDLSQVT
nr:hypothetical protein [Tanacetum cinerariifolium]